jgi:hypothetical protein
LLFTDFDKEKSLDEPGRVKDLDRVHMMDESKLKVEQLKQAGKDSKKIVPYRRGAKARKIANAAGPPPPAWVFCHGSHSHGVHCGRKEGRQVGHAGDGEVHQQHDRATLQALR